MKVARLDAMEQYILQNEKVTIRQLQKHFDVSINTLRRDLDELEQRGHVNKVYGGAAARALSSLTPMPKRFQQNVQNNRRNNDNRRPRRNNSQRNNGGNKNNENRNNN